MPGGVEIRTKKRARRSRSAANTFLCRCSPSPMRERAREARPVWLLDISPKLVVPKWLLAKTRYQRRYRPSASMTYFAFSQLLRGSWFHLRRQILGEIIVIPNVYHAREYNCEYEPDFKKGGYEKWLPSVSSCTVRTDAYAAGGSREALTCCRRRPI
jgi:hypothetical protein